MNGLIIKAIGGIYTVEASDGIYECAARGIFRKQGVSPMCGDTVGFSIDNDKSGIIESITPRKNEIIRPPLANLDILLYVTSVVEPVPNLTLIDKFIAICEYKKITPAVIITKIDKCSSDEIENIYKLAKIPIFKANNTNGEGSKSIRDFISGKLCAFTGNTGVGKSSLLNCMFPNLELSTNEISKKLGRGKHTTRHVELFKMPGGGYIADTPGFSSFETNRYQIIFKDELADCFREFSEFKDNCRFPNCSHTGEKGCAVIQAVNDGKIAPSRHQSYLGMYEEAKNLKEWEYKK
ncbi:MAG: ribosome small subunit-dependent GTPase A [Ruminococcus sp.]|nr:ribosome small subunit-dependent GTPase A [Ruminococcus sp.]